MADDFDVDEMLEAPYRKDVSTTLSLNRVCVHSVIIAGE